MQRSRRTFLQQSSQSAVATALASWAHARVQAAEANTIQLALVGCGGRGSGAVADALNSPQAGPIKLIAMADLFADRMARSHGALAQQFGARIDVPQERKFIGFDAYKKAIDCLRPGDVALITGYAGWRPPHLEYAVERGVHVFMEKSFACDPPGARRIIAAGEAAQKKNLKIAAGLMCRHSAARQALIERIRAGELGDLHLVRAYRMQPVPALGPKPASESELHWQIRNFTKFFWVSGGLFAEMTIHQIDEICWLKDAYPVSAHGIGGRSPQNNDRGQNFDSYSIEYTFADGTKALVGVRYLQNCHDEFATYVHGTKCAAQFSGSIHAPTVRQYRDQRLTKENLVWQPAADPCTPWQAEWNVLLQAIREDKPHNEARRAALSNVADMMGRAAVHSGQMITWDAALASNFQWCPNLDSLDSSSPAPLTPDSSGRYPVPAPGEWVEM